jgi:hypothetical protein
MKEPGLDDRHRDRTVKSAESTETRWLRRCARFMGTVLLLGLPTPTNWPTFCRRHLLISR